MIKVYFESQNHAEIVAKFKDERVYLACAEALAEYAKANRMIVTESIED
jgi:hypothetical protein